MTAGEHEIKLEYYENGGLARANLTWAPKCHFNVPGESWKGEYYNNANLVGNPTMVRNDGNGNPLLFNWGDGGPSPACGMGADYFSVRWTRSVYFDAGYWRFTVTRDNGVRLYVDGLLLIDRWVENVETNLDVVQLSAGWHQIKLEYFETFGTAAVNLIWMRQPGGCYTSDSSYGWKGEYFNNPDLLGTPFMKRNDNTLFDGINFGSGSPSSDCGIGADNFSVRWTAALTNGFTGYCNYQVDVVGGVRFYYEGQLQLDRWGVPGDNSFGFSLSGPGSQYFNLRLDLRDNVPQPRAHVYITGCFDPCSTNPQACLVGIQSKKALQIRP